MKPSDTASNLDENGLTPEELTAKEIEQAEEERKEYLDGLANKIESDFQKRATARLNKELEWDKAQRLYDSPLRRDENYITSDRPFGAPANSNYTRPIPNIVRTKCDTAISNSVSMQFAAGEKNWDLFPAPNETDPNVTEACRNMEKEIETQLAQAKYAMHCRRAIEERVILGTGIIKGPINTGKMKVEYERVGQEWVPTVTAKKTPSMEYVTCWRFYPDMSVTDFNHCTDAIELHPMTAIELSQYRNHPGFDKRAIDEILKGSDGTGPVKPDYYNERFSAFTPEVWSQSPYLFKNRYVVLEYHGPVTYDDLQKLGIEPTYESPTMEYYGEVWVCCGKVIRMELENIEGYYETPYSVAVWKRDPTSPFGYGHPLLLADPQRVVTEAYHMILDNASLTSGPQVAMYKKYIQPVDGDYTLNPNKVWLLTDPQARIEDAIKFFNPTNVIPNIMPVLQLARQFAEEESATSAIAAGLPSPQVTDTATGQLMMQQNSTTLLDFLAEEWDDQVTEKVIRRWYAWNMQYSPKQEIKGNYVIDVKSSSEYKNKQMYVRDLERLSMEVAQNPETAMSINVDELTRARLAVMHLPSNRIVKSKEEVEAARQAAASQPTPEQIDMQLKMAEAQREDRKLALEEAQLKFQLGQQQQREAWEHEEKMSANFARVKEAEAQVIKARSEVEVELYQAAQKNEQFMAKLANDKELAALATHADVFLNSMNQNSKRVDQLLTQEELDIKREKGTGI
jgi:hypothetical protein